MGKDSHAGIVLAVLMTIFPSFKFWIIGQVTPNLTVMDAALKVLLFALTALLSGIIGKGGQDLYTRNIKPYWDRKRNSNKRKKQ